MPKLQTIVKLFEGKYPLLQMGVHDWVWKTVTLQIVEYVVEGISAGRLHGLGKHVPKGFDNVPLLQSIDKLFEAVYPELHVGVHIVALGIGDKQLA